MSQNVQRKIKARSPFFGTSEASGGEIEICFVTEWFGLMQNMCLLSDVQLQCSRNVVLEVSVLFSGFILDYYFWFVCE